MLKKMGCFYHGKINSTSNDSKHLLEHRVEPLDTVRIAIIGLGNEGQMALERLPKINGAKVVAISDIDSTKVDESCKRYFNDEQLSLQIYIILLMIGKIYVKEMILI